tara:strand:+ start:2277 stop:2498 length:222 start_codon:yes stop_codon:yes gene_type:complete
MAILNKYSFEIQSLKNYQDELSPHTLSKFEFLAQNREQAEKFKKSLIDHFNTNMPFQSTIPRTTTILTETEYE